MQCSFSGLHSCCIYCTLDLCIGFLCTDISSLDSVQLPYVSFYVVVFCFPFFTSLSNIFPPSYLIKPSMCISKFPLQIKISTCICKFLLHALFTYPVFILEGPIHLRFTSPRYWKPCISSSFQFSLVYFVLKLFTSCSNIIAVFCSEYIIIVAHNGYFEWHSFGYCFQDIFSMGNTHS